MYSTICMHRSNPPYNFSRFQMVKTSKNWAPKQKWKNTGNWKHLFYKHNKLYIDVSEYELLDQENSSCSTFVTLLRVSWGLEYSTPVSLESLEETDESIVEVDVEVRVGVWLLKLWEARVWVCVAGSWSGCPWALAASCLRRIITVGKNLEATEISPASCRNQKIVRTLSLFTTEGLFSFIKRRTAWISNWQRSTIGDITNDNLPNLEDSIQSQGV